MSDKPKPLDLDQIQQKILRMGAEDTGMPEFVSLAKQLIIDDVRALIAENVRLKAENQRLRAGNERLKAEISWTKGMTHEKPTPG